jgi:hypothetical protein
MVNSTSCTGNGAKVSTNETGVSFGVGCLISIPFTMGLRRIYHLTFFLFVRFHVIRGNLRRTVTCDDDS